jgi:AraC-like DNA-binding protein
LDGNNLDKKSPLLKKALHFIESNLFKDISIGELARHIAASESSLLRTFHKEIHRTPIGYIKERRLDEALKLLKSNKYTIGEISDLVGYESVSAFTSSFKKRFGVTPQHYREI